MRPIRLPSKRKKTPESGVLRACLDLLEWQKIFHIRMNTGAMRIGDRFFRFGKPGTADIVAFPRKNGQVLMLWIECKSANGRQSECQKEFEKQVSNEDHHYLLVRDVDTLRRWLKEHGVI